MNKQELAALLEVISFFFVGLDLYGKERLGKMQTNILELSDKIYNRLTNVQNFEWNKQRSSSFMKVVYAISGIASLVQSIVTFLDDGHRSIGFLIFMLPFSFGAYLFTVLLVIVFIMGVAILLIRLVNLILRFLIWAFKFYQIEGVFLFIGTILFMVSKYIQLY